MVQEISFERFYRVLKDISASLHSETRVKDVLEIVVRKSAEAIYAKGAVVRILNLQTHQLDLFAAYGLREEYLSKGPISSQKLIADLCHGKKIRIIRDILHDPLVQYAKETWGEGIRMMMDAPLILGGDVIGILRFYFSESREFSEEELNFIIPIAEQGAFAIQKAQLIEKQRTQYDRLALQTEKLSALGRMAAGIAHEINNPLAGILLFSSNMLKKVPKEGPFKEGLEIVINETIRCKTIIQELLEFSRASEHKVAMTNINTIIEKSLRILENEFLLRHIRVEKQLLNEMPDLLLDPNQMEQVFINLLFNALQAIEDRGEVIVRSYMTTDGERIKCEIADTGCGIPSEHLAKIFEPFFSTKPKGTGLGLAVSYGIVRKHQGHIYVSSKKGQGTVFSLDFPIP